MLVVRVNSGTLQSHRLLRSTWKDKAIIRPDFDVMIFDEPLGAHDGFAVVPANERFNSIRRPSSATLHRRYFCT
jgi:hypothetical protein